MYVTLYNLYVFFETRDWVKNFSDSILDLKLEKAVELIQPFAVRSSMTHKHTHTKTSSSQLPSHQNLATKCHVINQGLLHVLLLGVLKITFRDLKIMWLIRFSDMYMPATVNLQNGLLHPLFQEPSSKKNAGFSDVVLPGMCLGHSMSHSNLAFNAVKRCPIANLDDSRC